MATSHQSFLQRSPFHSRGTRRAECRQRRVVTVRAGVLSPGDLILVAGATGGVGQLVTGKLLERGYKVRALTRSRNSQALRSFGPDCEVIPADLREASTIPSLLEGVSAVVAATGTTAFPSTRWEGNNGPRPTDGIATSNLIKAASLQKLSRFVLVTSAGVERQKQFPFLILNTFGVLKYKREAEVQLHGSGLPFTVIRPGRLTDGPFTSYDLNTLLKATAGTRLDVTLSLSDDLVGEASRISTAEAVVQALLTPKAENKIFALSSQEGEGPGTDGGKWEALFSRAQ